MDGAGAAGGSGSSEGPLGDDEGSALSATSKTVPFLLGVLLVFFLLLVVISYL